ncbi:cupin domain-containing protein [Rhizobium halophytocola]|uniref:Cupin superfamily protein n=1 Tax=Rhizobium halophytocola TaxID=735519 RepID=A0ABS4E0C6_9HYPH|nr:cupin domain-containing protein [Rhizobium halophytocola]MBP1851393.1 putative cupin superfamily protein [Rhizobium halophytocola]
MPMRMLSAGLAHTATQIKPETPAALPALVVAASDHMHLEPAPIDPSWVISGTPQARISRHSRSADSTALTALWDCTAGEFRWFFPLDETVVIQQGEVFVRAEDGFETTLRAGDIAFFRANTWATWHVETYVRKVAFLRRPLPDSIASLLRIRDRLRTAMARG